MKKVDLIQTTILIIAILFGYSVLQIIIYLLSILGSDPYQLKGIGSGYLVPALVQIALTSIACVVLIRNASKYARMILRNEPEASWEDAPKWDLDRSNILFALFVGLGLYVVIQALPDVVRGVWEQFAGKIDSSPLKQITPGGNHLVLELLRLTIGLIVIYGAPTFTNFIEKNISNRLEGSPPSESPAD